MFLWDLKLFGSWLVRQTLLISFLLKFKREKCFRRASLQNILTRKRYMWLLPTLTNVCVCVYTCSTPCWYACQVVLTNWQFLQWEARVSVTWHVLVCSHQLSRSCVRVCVCVLVYVRQVEERRERATYTARPGKHTNYTVRLMVIGRQLPESNSDSELYVFALSFSALVNFINVKHTNFSYERHFLHTCN